MEKANEHVGSSTSSFTVDLFGPKYSSSPGFFDSIFAPPSSMVPGNANQGTTPDYYMSEKKNIVIKNGRRSVEPCYYNSSIFYGGQEVYSPTTPNTPQHNFKKYGDQNESNSSDANWWQGSLYY